MWLPEGQHLRLVLKGEQVFALQLFRGKKLPRGSCMNKAQRTEAGTWFGREGYRCRRGGTGLEKLLRHVLGKGPGTEFWPQ